MPKYPASLQHEGRKAKGQRAHGAGKSARPGRANIPANPQMSPAVDPYDTLPTPEDPGKVNTKNLDLTPAEYSTN